jgi:hypothetical protein
MDPTQDKTATAKSWRLKVVRYSLADLLAEVALEHDTGAFGQQKLQQKEIAKLFPKKTRKRHGA